MTNFLKLMTLTTFVAFSSTAIAQETETPATDAEPTAEAATQTPPATTEPEAAPTGTTPEGLDMGENVVAADAPGTTYVKEKFEAWELRCIRVEADKKEPCQLFQLLKDKDGNAVAEMNLVVLKNGGQAAAGATVIVPLETLLTKQLTLAVDAGSKKRYPFRFCSATGCYAQIGFSNGDISAFKRGAAATLSVVPAFAPKETISVDMSLSGFTKAYDTLSSLTK